MPGARPRRAAASTPAPTHSLPIDLRQYPKSWEEFIGQERAKFQLQIAARSAAARGVPMDHVLIDSPVPGVGKTALALLTARELGGRIKLETGPIKPEKVPFIFTELKDGDILFIDEIHRLAEGGAGKAEWLLLYLQDGVMKTQLGIERAPRVTVIGATTDAGRLPETIKDRFLICPTIDPYTLEEGAQIALMQARKEFGDAIPLPTGEVAAAIARAANVNPRKMRRVLVAIRDLARAGALNSDGGNYALEQALDFAGVTADGLPVDAQNYLIVLFEEYRGTPAGAKPLADRLGQVGMGLKQIEQVLLDHKLIAYTGRGRTLTTAGIARAKELLGLEDDVVESVYDPGATAYAAPAPSAPAAPVYTAPAPAPQRSPEPTPPAPTAPVFAATVTRPTFGHQLRPVAPVPADDDDDRRLEDLLR